MRAIPDAVWAAPWVSTFDLHVAPLVRRLSASSGLSSRLLWENAGWYLVWALREAGVARPLHDPAIRAWLSDVTSGHVARPRADLHRSLPRWPELKSCG